MVRKIRKKLKLDRIILVMLTAVISIIGFSFLAQSAEAEDGTRGPPDVTIKMTPSFDTSYSYVEDGEATVFYGDQLKMIPDVDDPDGDYIEDYEWKFKPQQGSAPWITVNDDVFDITAGVDALYSNEEEGDPVMPEYNSGPLEYKITLKVRDSSGATGSETINVTVFPYAQHNFSKMVQYGPANRNASVSIIFRGLPDEVAPSHEKIDPEHPVFVYIEESSSPDPSLGNRGGIGPVYNLRHVGCYLQDDSEGIIRANLTFPFRESDIGYLGAPEILLDDLSIEYYDNAQKRFFPIFGSQFTTDEGSFITAEVDHFSIYTIIIDSIYSHSHPNYEKNLPDLLVQAINFSRNPTSANQAVNVLPMIRNDGVIHARNVNVRIFVEDDLIGDQRIDLIEGNGGTAMISEMFIPHMINGGLSREDQTIKVQVNPQRSIQESQNNYGNNDLRRDLIVLSASNSLPTIGITVPENNSVVMGSVLISGNSTDESTEMDLGIVYDPYGENEFEVMIEKSLVVNPSILAVDFIVLDEFGKEIPGMRDLVVNIFELNLSMNSTLITYRDRDRNGKLSAGDSFILKNESNGGKVREGFTLLLYNSTIKFMEISFDGENWTRIESSIDRESGNWTIDWDSTTVLNGSTILMLRAYDGLDHSNVVEIALDVQNPEPNKIPSILISEPTDGSTVSGIVRIKGSVSDEDGTVEKVEVSIDGAAWENITLDGILTWDFKWDTSTLTNGEYEIEVRAYDGENYSSVLTIKLTVSNKKAKEGSGSDDFIPGFELMTLIASLGAVIFIVKRRTSI